MFCGGWGGDVSAVVRLAQGGQADVIDAMADAGVSFDLPAHLDEAGGEPISLIAEALNGWDALGSFWGTEVSGATLHRYAETIGHLLRGGASPKVTAPKSLADAWPVVDKVDELFGVRLTGWATPEFESRCWQSVEGAGFEAAEQGALAA